MVAYRDIILLALSPKFLKK